jgi:hypothetical protein
MVGDIKLFNLRLIFKTFKFTGIIYFSVVRSNLPDWESYSASPVFERQNGIYAASGV